MKHSEAFELLQDFIDGELTDPQQSAVAAHLAECAECRQEVAGLRALLGQTQELLSHPVASGLFTAPLDFGAAAFDSDGRTPDELIAKADERLYRAKMEGKNRIVSE